MYIICWIYFLKFRPILRYRYFSSEVQNPLHCTSLVLLMTCFIVHHHCHLTAHCRKEALSSQKERAWTVVQTEITLIIKLLGSHMQVSVVMLPVSMGSGHMLFHRVLRVPRLVLTSALRLMPSGPRRNGSLGRSTTSVVS